MTLEFNIKLQANQYINWNNVQICFSIEIKSKADDDNDIPANTLTVNNFFCILDKGNIYKKVWR